MRLTRQRREEEEAQAHLEETRALLRDAMKDLDGTLARMDEVKEQTTLLEKRSQQYLADIEKTKKEHTALEQDLSEMEIEQAVLLQDIADYKTLSEQRKHEKETLEKDLIYLRSKAYQEHDAYENTMTSYATQQSAKERQISDLTAQIAQLEAKKAQVEDTIAMHATNMEQDKSRIDEEWAKIREREEVVDRRAEDARMLRHRLKSLCAEKKIVFPIADE